MAGKTFTISCENEIVNGRGNRGESNARETLISAVETEFRPGEEMEVIPAEVRREPENTTCQN
eukprot:439440-Amorphochlora_amoeboformis.AAC.1